jgi:O-antigen/teichoic acid export membrane protein
MSIYGLLAVLVINIFAPAIVTVLGGKEMLPAVNIIRLFSIIVFTTHLSNYYITVGLWSLGYEKIFRNLMIYSSVVFLFIYLLLWTLNVVNVYTITLTPIIVDIYLIIHIYSIWKGIKSKSNDKGVQKYY